MKEHENEMLEAALSYARDLRWAAFPCYEITQAGACACGNATCDSPGKHPRVGHGHRDATTDEATIHQWWSRWPEANIGVATGTVSGIDVLDVDPRHGGDDSLTELEAQHGALPDTVEQLTGGGGRHILFKHHEGVRNRTGTGSGLLAGLDVRGDGGYIIVAPSRHVSGRHYRWEVSSQPVDLPLAEWPQWMLEMLLLDGSKGAGPVPAIEGAIHEGNRNATLASLAGSMRRRGMGESAIAAALLEENKRCHPPLAEDEVRGIAISVARYEPAKTSVLELIVTNSVTAKAGSPQSGPLPATDMGNAVRLVRRHGQDIRYCGLLGGWFVYDDTRWRRDDANRIMELAKDTVIHIGEDLEGITDEDTRKSLVKHIFRSQSQRSLQAMIALAASDPAVCMAPDGFDQHPMLFNVQNGTIDLKTGECGPHRREDLLTQMAGVAHDPAATCPRWQSFLAQVMQDNQESVAFLQRLFGYAITGATHEDAFFIFYGSGCNGKTTLTETLQSMMGDYGQTAQATTFLEKHNDSIPNDLAALRGARLVLASETGPRRSLDEALIKRVTGGDMVAARFLHREFFTYRPTYKLVIATNDKPRVLGSDRGIWRRTRMIPFSASFEGREDKQLAEKLEQELSGILNWALDGCRKWQHEGLGSAPEVAAATQAYRDEMDVLADFIDEWCVSGQGEQVSKSRLYEAYVDWAERAKERPLTKINFGKTLAHRMPGLDQGRSGAGGTRRWLGIGLKSERGNSVSSPAEQDQDVPYDV
jgi:putative DNA primase/helicase